MGKIIKHARLTPWQRAARVPPSALSTRQREVCQLLAESMTDGEIAAELGIREKCVAWHVIQLSRRLGLRHRNLAIITRYAAMKHIIDVEPSLPLAHLHD